MAKKSKKQVRKSSATRSPIAEVSAPTPTSGAGFRDFNPDYAPVIKDLKRIGALAGTFFVVLVVLAFFLR